MRNAGIFLLLRRFAVPTMVCVLSGVLCHYANAVSVGLYADRAGVTCDVEQPPLMETAKVYVILENSSGTTGVQFAMPIPACAPYTVASWSSDYLVIGQPEDGIALGLGGCIAGEAVILEVDLMRVGDPTTDCCALRLMPHPDAITGSVEVYDCNFQVQPALDSGLWLIGDDSCAPIDAPSNPVPPDHASDVSLDVVLNCELHKAEFFSGCVPLGFELVTVYFGTGQDPPAVWQGLPYDPPALEPGTTYYWRVVHSYFSAAPVSSPVWAFTTTNANAATLSTWGRIKALYR